MFNRLRIQKIPQKLLENLTFQTGVLYIGGANVCHAIDGFSAWKKISILWKKPTLVFIRWQAFLPTLASRLHSKATRSMDRVEKELFSSVRIAREIKMNKRRRKKWCFTVNWSFTILCWWYEILTGWRRDKKRQNQSRRGCRRRRWMLKKKKNKIVSNSKLIQRKKCMPSTYNWSW